MKKPLAISILVLAAIAAGIFYILTEPNYVSADALPDHLADPENGEYFFWAGGCAACHAAPGSETDADRMRLTGGLGLKTPFGTFYAPNISPDPDTGIGGWSALEFVNAMTRGISPDGRHYYPAFPYASYQRMAYEDLMDLKAFLDTLIPVASGVPAHDLSFPFSLRRGLGLWKWLYLDGTQFEPDPAFDDDVNRGRYLAEGPAHCGECHTPRSLLGGLDRSRWMAGAVTPDGKGFVPNITPHETGLGGWSEADIVFALETGFTPEFEALGGTMSEIQQNMAKLSGEDRRAIARYLKSIPALTKSKK